MWVEAAAALTLLSRLVSPRGFKPDALQVHQNSFGFLCFGEHGSSDVDRKGLKYFHVLFLERAPYPGLICQFPGMRITPGVWAL